MSYINNPSIGGGVSISSLDVVLSAKSDEVRGIVTGLSSTPSSIISQAIYEEGVVVQSGLQYLFKTYNFTSNSFSWILKVVDNEYWPGPGSVTIKVDYIWN